MTTIDNENRKQEIADQIKFHVSKINEYIVLANIEHLRFDIKFTQNNNFPPDISHLNVFINESISF